ncbi:hypothetical protein TNCV_4409701 [Trichonephila clavipes]|nr:hypothetical protein TNCV_4409701 [Trichonephila clavipes]
MFSLIYLKGIFGPAVKCPLVCSGGLATGGQVNVVHQQVLCALAEVLVEDVCFRRVGTLGTKDEKVTAEMDKGIMVADSFRSEQERCAELALCSVVTWVPKKTLEQIKYSLFWSLSSNVKKFCESCKKGISSLDQLGLKTDHPVHLWQGLRLPKIGNMDLLGPIDPPSLKDIYILCLVDPALGTTRTSRPDCTVLCVLIVISVPQCLKMWKSATEANFHFLGSETSAPTVGRRRTRRDLATERSIDLLPGPSLRPDQIAFHVSFIFFFVGTAVIESYNNGGPGSAINKLGAVELVKRRRKKEQHD